MRTLNLRLNFFWDEGDDIGEFLLIVPNNVSDQEVIETLTKEHEYLCENEDDEDIYNNEGRTPETLLNYVCGKYYKWTWRDLQFDIDMNFE